MSICFLLRLFHVIYDPLRNQQSTKGKFEDDYLATKVERGRSINKNNSSALDQ